MNKKNKNFMISAVLFSGIALLWCWLPEQSLNTEALFMIITFLFMGCFLASGLSVIERKNTEEEIEIMKKNKFQCNKCGKKIEIGDDFKIGRDNEHLWCRECYGRDGGAIANWLLG